MFYKLGRISASRPWVICAAWVAAGILLSLIAPRWDSQAQDDDVRFLPARCPSVRAYQVLEKAFPKDVFASRLIFAVEREAGPLTAEDFQLVDRVAGDLERLRADSPDLKLGNILSHKDGLIGTRLTSRDGQCTLIQVSLGTPFLALQTRDTVAAAEKVVRERLGGAAGGGLHVYTTGQAGIGRDLTAACGDSLEDTTLATIVLVVVVLLFVYRSPLLALVPLLTIAVSVWVALKALALMTLIPGVYLVNISQVFAIVILYGAGTDYCLFLISRYREELSHGRTTEQALEVSTGKVGGALTASAGTVMVGLGLMALAEFAKVRYSGPGIALSLAIALLASLTLTPALLRLLGDFVFWPVRPPSPQPMFVLMNARRKKRNVWESISRHVAHRPVVVWCASVLVLAPLAVVGSQVRPDYRATSQLAPSSQSLRGLDALQRHFTAGETGPLTVLLVSPHDWTGRSGRLEIDQLSRGFAGLDNVAEVRSLTQPLGSPLPDERPAVGGGGLFAGLVQALRPDLLGGVLGQAREAAQKHYVSTMPGDDGGTLHVTRLDVILKTDPFSAESQETRELIQTWLDRELPASTILPDGLRAETYGVTVGAHDLASVTESDRLRVNAVITVGIMLILLVIVRSPVMAVYLLLTVLLSYFATLGATALAGYLWAGEFLFALDWRVMFFLFTILVAVGEDYNILLVSRAVQEQEAHGPVEGMRRALARTGGTITSCGLIMAGTFATLMLTNLNSLLQIGFALAFGVLADTFIVRPFLVPTFAIFLAQRRQSAEPQEEDEHPQPPTAAPDLDRIPAPFRMAG